MATYTPRFPGRGTIVEQSINKGRAVGRTEDILRILALRGVEISEAARDRITTCTDLDTLGTWFDRAITADSEPEVFDEG